jgi:hypothetical protein
MPKMGKKHDVRPLKDPNQREQTLNNVRRRVDVLLLLLRLQSDLIGLLNALLAIF